MNIDIINRMTTKYYKALKIMYDHKVKKNDGSFFVPMTQVEIADETDVSKITMNAIIKGLKADHLLYSPAGHRGRYYLTDKAIILIEGVEAILRKMDKEEKREKE